MTDEQRQKLREAMDAIAAALADNPERTDTIRCMIGGRHVVPMSFGPGAPLRLRRGDGIELRFTVDGTNPDAFGCDVQIVLIGSMFRDPSTPVDVDAIVAKLTGDTSDAGGEVSRGPLPRFSFSRGVVDHDDIPGWPALCPSHGDDYREDCDACRAAHEPLATP